MEAQLHGIILPDAEALADVGLDLGCRGCREGEDARHF